MLSVTYMEEVGQFTKEHDSSMLKNLQIKYKYKFHIIIIIIFLY